MDFGIQMFITKEETIKGRWMILLWMLVLFSTKTEQREMTVTFNTKPFDITFPEHALNMFFDCLCFNEGKECTFMYQIVKLDPFYFNVSDIKPFHHATRYSSTLHYICESPTFAPQPSYQVSCRQDSPCIGRYCSITSHLENIKPGCPCINLQWKYPHNIFYSGMCVPSEGSCSAPSGSVIAGDAMCPSLNPETSTMKSEEVDFVTTASIQASIVASGMTPSTSEDTSLPKTKNSEEATKSVIDVFELDLATSTNKDLSVTMTEMFALSTYTGMEISGKSNSNNQTLVIGTTVGSALAIIIIIIAVISLYFFRWRKQPVEQHVNKISKGQGNSNAVCKMSSNANNIVVENRHEEDPAYTDYNDIGSIYYEITEDGELSSIKTEEFSTAYVLPVIGTQDKADDKDLFQSDYYNILHAKENIDSIILATYDASEGTFVECSTEKKSITDILSSNTKQFNQEEQFVYSMARPISADIAGPLDMGVSSPVTSGEIGVSPMQENEYFNLEAVSDVVCGEIAENESNCFVENSITGQTEV